jgi:hypothetical protein
MCLDGSRSFDPDDELPPVGGVGSGVGAPNLHFEWSFAIWYYRNGQPVYHIPEGSRAYESAEGFDTATPCFTPDKPGDYVLNLTVTDPYGASLTDQVAIHAEECTNRYTCWYPEGWNLLSLPVQPVNPSTEAILSGTSAEGAQAYRYTAGYETTDSLTFTEGYWVHFVSPDNISVIGREIRNDVTLRLAAPGWHLISSPFSIDWERVLVFVNGVERFVGEPQARAVIDDYCACFDPEASVYRISEEILPCQGYWIRTKKSDVVLRLEWTQYTAARPPAEGGCSSGQISTLPPAPVDMATQTNIRALAYPNPVRHSTVTFELKGSFTAEAIRVQVFTASGHQIWEGEGVGSKLQWEPLDSGGGQFPWGPYPYCCYGLLDGQWVRTGCGVLFLAELD